MKNGTTGDRESDNIDFIRLNTGSSEIRRCSLVLGREKIKDPLIILLRTKTSDLLLKVVLSEG